MKLTPAASAAAADAAEPSRPELGDRQDDKPDAFSGSLAAAMAGREAAPVKEPPPRALGVGGGAPGTAELAKEALAAAITKLGGGEGLAMPSAIPGGRGGLAADSKQGLMQAWLAAHGVAAAAQPAEHGHGAEPGKPAAPAAHTDATYGIYEQPGGGGAVADGKLHAGADKDNNAAANLPASADLSAPMPDAKSATEPGAFGASVKDATRDVASLGAGAGATPGSSAADAGAVKASATTHAGVGIRSLDVPDDVTMRVAGVPGAGHTARVELNHPELGPVQIQLTADGDDLNLRAVTTTVASAMVLRESESTLRTTIATQRLRLRGMRVDVADRENRDVPDVQEIRGKSPKKRALDVEV